MVRLVDDLRAACKGHPAAAIQWPHRLLHDAANEIERLNAGVTVSAPTEAAREAVIQAAVQLVYDGMSEAGWHRVRRAVEAMEQSAAPNRLEYIASVPAKRGVSLDATLGKFLHL